MDKFDLERMLLDPDGLKLLAERASSIKARFGESDGLPRTKAMDVLPPPARAPSADEIQATDSDHGDAPQSVIDLGCFIPELIDKSPNEVLIALTDRFKKDKSQQNFMLLESAINQLTRTGTLAPDAEKLISQAHDTMGGHIFCRFYEHANFRGRSLHVTHNGARLRYLRVRTAALRPVGNDRISSLTISAGADELGGYVILFEHDRFIGRYKIFTTTPGNPTVENRINYVGDFMNDRTSSILSIRRSVNELRLIALGERGLRRRIADYVDAVPRVSLRGNPIVTWDMWPDDNPEKRFIYIKVPVRIEIDNWPDYDAEIMYRIYLYVRGGNLSGYVYGWRYWVDRGVKADDIARRLDNEIPGTIGSIQNMIDENLGLANIFGPFQDLYFLPGRHDRLPISGAEGHTDDDITLVMVGR